ncbi:MAG TPA: glycosyltransferase family 2 protein [Pirellulaceae bacterium]|nr:glycosyltransferase family 2 protein [Planctomycetales bacterium]HRX80069.1 glycosyltransferase family 2 protein [Pirellulaceae bacterium]
MGLQDERDGFAVQGNALGAVVVNFNTSTETLECIASLLRLGTRIDRIIVVDNASAESDRRALRVGIEHYDATVFLVEAQENLGFSGGCNLGIARLLELANIQRVLLLNSDALAYPAMSGWLDTQSADIAGATVVKAGGGGEVDSRGIVMYSSALASNRQGLEEPLLGPTGGCAIYSRRFLEHVQHVHGYIFDPDFFCYAEDTDLAARAILLGYVPEHCDDVVAEHIGQVSSGGGFNGFVLYHGIRNSIWVGLKCFPLWSLLKRAPFILALHIGICMRHGSSGQLRTLLRLYFDALRGMPRMLRKRRAIQKARVASIRDFEQRISRRFYEPRYVRQAVRELMGARETKR